MFGHTYPPLPVTAIDCGVRENQDTISEYTIKVPSKAYSPNTRTPSYEDDKASERGRARSVAYTDSDAQRGASARVEGKAHR